MKQNIKTSWLVIGCSILMLLLSAGCGVYSFNERGTLEAEARTFKVNFINNTAPYVNPKLSPLLTESVRQKIIRQTRLSNVGSTDTAHYEISATITDYSVSTSGVTTTNGRPVGSINRLSISVQISINNRIKQKPIEHTINRPFDFAATLSLQQAENQLQDEIIRNLTDEIFNRIFSDW